MTMFGQYTPPPPPALEESDPFKPSENVDRPLVIKVLERKEGIVTDNSPQGAPGVVAHVLDLSTGAKYRRALFMSGNAVDGFTPHVGRPMIVVRLTWKEPRKVGGRKFIGVDPATPHDMQLAEQYVAQMGDPFVGPDFAPPVQAFAPPAPAAAPAWQAPAGAQPWTAQAPAPAVQAAPVAAPAAQPVAQSAPPAWAQPAADASGPAPWEQAAAAPAQAPAAQAAVPPWERQG